MTRKPAQLGVAIHGLVLIEVLVAATVVTIAAVGMTYLQIYTLQANRAALERTQALNLLDDISERIRANPQAWSSASSSYAFDSATNATSTASCSNTTGCTPAQMASTDVAQWRSTLSSVLPQGSLTTNQMGTISYNATTLTHSILIQWDDRETDLQSASMDIRFSLSAP